MLSFQRPQAPCLRASLPPDAHRFMLERAHSLPWVLVSPLPDYPGQYSPPLGWETLGRNGVADLPGTLEASLEPSAHLAGPTFLPSSSCSLTRVSPSFPFSSLPRETRSCFLCFRGLAGRSLHCQLPPIHTPSGPARDQPPILKAGNMQHLWIALK